MVGEICTCPKFLIHGHQSILSNTTDFAPSVDVRSCFRSPPPRSSSPRHLGGRGRGGGGERSKIPSREWSEVVRKGRDGTGLTPSSHRVRILTKSAPTTRWTLLIIFGRRIAFSLEEYNNGQISSPPPFVLVYPNRALVCFLNFPHPHPHPSPLTLFRDPAPVLCTRHDGDPPILLPIRPRSFSHALFFLF